MINKYTISSTLAFPDILRENPLDSNQENVSHHADSQFKSIPLDETIDFILDETYIQKKLESFYKKSVFKKLLNELRKGCTFSVDGRLMGQVDGCPIGDSISVVLSNIFCVKMESDVVKPLKPNFTSDMSMIFIVNISRINQINFLRNSIIITREQSWQ